MHGQPDDTLAELVRRFEDCSLPKAEWTHEAHLRAGLWYVSQQGAVDALAALRVRIRRYNESVGGINSDDAGYHETLTRLYVRLIDDWLRARAGAGPDPDTAAALVQALGDREIPLRHYTRERLFSREARLGWVEPDLLPLPVRPRSP